MRRYLPEAVLFLVAAGVLAALYQRIFDPSFFIVLTIASLATNPIVLACLFMMLMVAILAWKRGGELLISAFMGVIFAFAIAFGSIIFPIQGAGYDLALICLAVVVIALGYTVWRIAREKWRVYAYAFGAAFLAVIYFVTPWLSEVALVLMKGTSMQTALRSLPPTDNTFPIQKFTVRRGVVGYFYDDGGPVAAIFNFLVYDPKDEDVNSVEKNLRARDVDKCKFSGHRIVSQYYAIDIDCD